MQKYTLLIDDSTVTLTTSYDIKPGDIVSGEGKDENGCTHEICGTVQEILEVEELM